MTTSQLALFDYAQLDRDTRIVVQQRTTEIKALMRRTAQDIINIGEKLIEVKARLPHGAFGRWLESEFVWTPMTATRFMNVAERFKNNNLLDLDVAPSALYLLAGPSTPEAARTEAISRATQGERITHAAAKTIVSEHKEPESPPPAWQPMPGTRDEPITTEPRYCPKCHHEQQVAASLVHTSVQIRCEVCQNLQAGWSWKAGPSEPHCVACGTALRPDDITRCQACEAESGQQEPESESAPVNGFNYKRDSRRITDQDVYEPKGMDACQTPAYAIDPLLVYLRAFDCIWEPAAGDGHLVDALYDAGYDQSEVISGDILTGQNFFDDEPVEPWDCIVTNPPFSLKFKWLARCYELGKPFALLLPVETLGTQAAQKLFSEYGLELILMDKRIDFKMPHKGWASSAQFPTAWFTWGLNIGQQITYTSINKTDQY